jgi:RNA-binding protein
LADELTGKQRRHLRALGHHLHPVVQIGQQGVNDALVQQADAQLQAHELIKVRIGENSPQERHDAAEMLAGRTHAHLTQILGRTALLYRARKDNPQILLPRK